MRPSLVPPTESEEPSPAVLWPLLTFAVLLPRALLFPFNENFFGDAVARTDLAARWASHPHLITSFRDGTFQYGPLHLYAIGLFLKLGLGKLDAGRWASLLFGTASLVPLYLFSKRLFGWRAAVGAVLFFAGWGLHIQLSTTAASEALGCFLFLGTAWQLSRALTKGTFAPLVLAALFLNLLCAVRYDAWLFIPLLCGLLFFYGNDRAGGTLRALCFGLLCLPFPLAWMHGNALATGDPLFPIRDIDLFHRAWAEAEIAWKGEAAFRLEGLLFWPAVALLSLSPLVAAFGVAGMAAAWKTRPKLRWMVLWAVIPTVFYAFRSAVLLTFVPMARFAVNQVVLLIPFAAYGFSVVAQKLLPTARRVLQWGTVGSAVLCQVGLAAFTYGREGRVEDAVRTVSPLVGNPQVVLEAARIARQQLTSTSGTLLLDTDAQYLDMQVAFFSELPEQQLARLRWRPLPGEVPSSYSFEERLKVAKLELMVLSESGELQKDVRFRREGSAVWFNGQRFVRVLGGVEDPLSVYRAE